MADLRSVAGVTVTVPEPTVADGIPCVPRYWVRHSATATLRQGTHHIHAIPDPDPVWSPPKADYTQKPPVAGVGDHRWTVNTLPNPSDFHNDWYWVGEPSSHDSTVGIATGARQWKADSGTGGPSWNSFFPYKPSLSAVDAHVPGDHSIHHPKCLHFNSHYVEHMWLDFGANIAQPFTWVIAGATVSDPYPGYEHSVLDSGRNPDDVGFPRLSASAVSTERTIKDNLAYRTRISSLTTDARMRASSTGRDLRVHITAHHYPRMFVAMFNGSKSTIAVYDPFAKRTATGIVTNGTGHSHRYAVLGRRYGYISQEHASNLMIFEVRYWHRLLTVAELNSQYDQLSTTYKFDSYRQL